MSTTTLPAITRTITVNAPADKAFRVFTEQFHTWWPAGYAIGSDAWVMATIEPRPQGRWFERGEDGTECDWGRVLAWEPPHRLVLSWHINGEWEYHPDPARASEIEVLFIAEGPDTTRIELEHRLIERHGEHAASLRAAIDAPNGWNGILASYADVVARP